MSTGGLFWGWHLNGGCKWAKDYHVTPLKLAEEWLLGTKTKKVFSYYRTNKFVPKKDKDGKAMKSRTGAGGSKRARGFHPYRDTIACCMTMHLYISIALSAFYLKVSGWVSE